MCVCVCACACAHAHIMFIYMYMNCINILHSGNKRKRIEELLECCSTLKRSRILSDSSISTPPSELKVKRYCIWYNWVYDYCMQVVHSKSKRRIRSFLVSSQMKPVVKSLKYNHPPYTVKSLFRVSAYRKAAIAEIVKVNN